MSSAGADRTLVIRHGTLIDGSGRPPVPSDALVIEGNRIKSVGRLPESLRSSESRDDVQVIDASGQWIMPGLIDAHSRSGDLQTLARDEIAAVVDEAHRRGVRVAIHSRGGASTRAAAEAGVDWIIHCDLASEADLDVVARAGAAILPTMTFLATVVEASGRYGQERTARS